METISFDELKQMVGELYIENTLLKKKIGYLENTIEQLMSAAKENGGVVTEEKEGKPQSPGD